MADRQGSDPQKHTPLHGISLANFGGNLNFGPTLVPASNTTPISFGNQPSASPTTGRGNVYTSIYALACEILFIVSLVNFFFDSTKEKITGS